MASTDIPLVGPLINRIFGTRNERMVKRLVSRVERIDALEPEMRRLTDEQLRAKTDEFKERVKGGESAEDVLPEAFAVAREAMDRNVGIRNIFSPKWGERFDPGRLPEGARRLYDETRARIDAAEPAAPEGPLQGNEEPVAPWLWVDIPAELYEAVRELYPQSKPPFRARPFDVQLIGATVLHQGKIAEMKTGEGKTIVAPLACYLAVIEGLRVHVVTVNDYLVQRDRDWVFPFHRALGLTVGAIHPQHMQPEQRKAEMYECDVVYGTTSEFGFDYLRDNMKRSADQQVQRAREFAIVDEVDSTLVDEARTPLIISGQAHDDQPRYDMADQLARHLVQMNKPWDAADEKVESCKKRIKGTEGDIRNARDKAKVPDLERRLAELRSQLPSLEAERDRFVQYFEVERDRKQVTLTHEGVSEAQKKADIGSFYVGENTDVPHLLSQALRAHVIYERDADYVVMPTQDPQSGRRDPDVVIVDVNTGRPMVGRQWSDGLHQAVQAREGLRIRAETQTVASITIQNFFKMYERLAGMTGTADTEAQEFHDIYKLDVVTIPTNVPVVRNDFDDVVYLSQKDKWDSIVEEIKRVHDTGQPILVGTTSVEKSEMLSKMLTSKHGIKHEVLNAKQHEREASIVEGAGQLGAVMIATNMAGRGTDIKLGAVTREAQREFYLRRGVAPKDLAADDDDASLRAKVYRKIAPKELGLTKRDVEALAEEELELRLLRHWTLANTYADEKKVQAADAEALREMLDAEGTFRMHRLRWVESLEELGGLHVIGTERHESRRIDNQLRGRSGRQGDRGSSRFFVSLEDDLMKLFAGQTTMKLLSRMGMKEGDAIEHPMLSKSIGGAQRKVEERNFQIRKNILEYDEVMEHQRQEFYGMRQRVLDGRDLRGLIFGFIEEAVVAAVDRYLDPSYPIERCAEFASERLGVSVPPERLRGRDAEDALDIVKRIAKEEGRHEISITLGEYIPEGGEAEDIDSKSLVAWARTRFGVEMTGDEVHALSPAEITDRLADAAERRIEQTDVSGVGAYLVEHYGAEQLVEWVKRTTEIEVPAAQIIEQEQREDVVKLVLDKVNAAYDKREVEYPVDFEMQLTMGLMRQNPAGAAEHLVRWANQRFDLGWDASVVRTRVPQQLRDELLKASARFVEEDRLTAAIDEALAFNDADSLGEHLEQRYNATVPRRMKRLRGEEWRDAVRARIEAILRSELVWFEQTVMLQVLDPLWKDHLYAMDQLRDSIGYRAFSQQDPRIEYKREGARLFTELMEKARDRVTEYVFRLRMMPQVGAPAPQVAPAPAPAGPNGEAGTPAAAGRLRAAGSGISLGGGSSITGPGLDRGGG